MPVSGRRPLASAAAREPGDGAVSGGASAAGTGCNADALSYQGLAITGGSSRSRRASASRYGCPASRWRRSAPAGGAALLVGPGGDDPPYTCDESRRQFCISSGDLKTIGIVHLTSSAELSALYGIMKCIAEQRDN